jgi:CRP-like cAMP-binding protein
LLTPVSTTASPLARRKRRRAMMQTKLSNRLLSLMSAEDFALLAPSLQPVDLPPRFIIASAEARIEHVYLIESGIASTIATSPDGHKVEAGLLGRDGISPMSALLGCDRTPHLVVVQVSGHGHRLEIGALQAAMDRSSSLRGLLLRFAQVMMVQIAYTALSNAAHSVDERLARWLLMCADRQPGEDIPMTHDFMALMLAVRRPSVTTSLHTLEGLHFIRSLRGVVSIRDRAAMEAFAHDAYGTPEAEYRRLIGPMS